MAKIKKAQEGAMLGVDKWIQKAACRRGVCGKGSISDKRAAKMEMKESKRNARLDRKDERAQAREDRREAKRWERMNLKKGGTVKKALFGIGVGKEERRARKEERQLKRSCRGGSCGGRAKGYIGYGKNGSKVKKVVKKAQDGIVSYKTPSGTKVSVDTSGYAAGKKRFPTKLEGKVGTTYGMMGKKSTNRAIESSQGKPYKRQGMNPTNKAKKAFVKSKSGSKISKKK